MSSAKVLDVSLGLTNTTLDIIGETVFDYHFGSLDAVQQHNVPSSTISLPIQIYILLLPRYCLPRYGPLSQRVFYASWNIPRAAHSAFCGTRNDGLYAHMAAHELAHHPEDQDRIRDEITARRAKMSSGQEDLGVPVLVSTLPSVWGPDADKWNPGPFMNPDLKNNQVPVGLHANLRAFGMFRFALLEMQSTIVEIVENVKLTRPPGMEDIVMMRVPVGAIMAPMVKGKFDERTRMPLGVEF
ncbi:hypothetical protein DFH09DRAFT_1364460 [Mycena vulgaris]|nr:hypothetical protein DFH09DRAFT_1364460 [Mycena vulgaris]